MNAASSSVAVGAVGSWSMGLMLFPGHYDTARNVPASY